MCVGGVGQWLGGHGLPPLSPWFGRNRLDGSTGAGRSFGRISGNHHPMSPSPLAFGHSSCLPAHRPSLSFLASLTFLSTGACLPISFGPVFCSSSPSLRLSFVPAVVLTHALLRSFLPVCRPTRKMMELLPVQLVEARDTAEYQVPSSSSSTVTIVIIHHRPFAVFATTLGPFQHATSSLSTIVLVCHPPFRRRRHHRPTPSSTTVLSSSTTAVVAGIALSSSSIYVFTGIVFIHRNCPF